MHLRGCSYWLLGRYEEALADFSLAVRLSRRLGDVLWEGRSLGNRADVLRALGRLDEAESDYVRSEELMNSIDNQVEALLSSHNRAMVAFARGDVITSLAMIDKAEARFRGFGVDPIELILDHLTVLIAARMAEEAHTLAASVLARSDLAPVWRADVKTASARANLLRENWDAAASDALEARRLHHAQGRRRGEAQSALLALEARYSQNSDRGEAPGTGYVQPDGRPALTPTARRVVGMLRVLGDPSLPEALLLLGGLAKVEGHPRVRARALAEAAESRHAGAPLSRAAGWLAAARLAEDAGDRRGLLHACRRGLDAVDEHRGVIGDQELRALATAYGIELTVAAAADVLAKGDPRGLVWWVERWRSTSLSPVPTAPPDDPELLQDIAALRDVTRRSSMAESDSILERERTRLENAVRSRYRHLRATSAVSPVPAIADFAESLNGIVMIYLTRVAHGLAAVTVAEGRFSLQHLGPFDIAAREGDFARFTLRRAAYGRSTDLHAAGERLQRSIFGNPPASWSAPQVLIVPPAHLLTVPFSLLPVFSDSAIAVSPSLTLWRRTTRDENQSTGHVALITGPGLTTREREVAGLRSMHPDAVVLEAAAASVQATLDLLEGARIGHIAAHGTFRADAPLFSSLALADGPLMVHDFRRLRHPPQRLVLSACDAGGLHPIGADEAIGLVSGLLDHGVKAVLASVVPVNDAATDATMQAVHGVLADGGTFADGLLAARRAAKDPLARATAAAFTAWGA